MPRAKNFMGRCSSIRHRGKGRSNSAPMVESLPKPYAPKRETKSRIRRGGMSSGPSRAHLIRSSLGIDQVKFIKGFATMPFVTRKESFRFMGALRSGDVDGEDDAEKDCSCTPAAAKGLEDEGLPALRGAPSDSDRCGGGFSASIFSRSRSFSLLKRGLGLEKRPSST